MDAYNCPECGTGIASKLTDGQEIECAGCSRRFRVLLDANTHSVGFVPTERAELVEPLHLPQGSIRALSTFIVSAAAWLLMLSGRAVPVYVFSLLLTVISYYFGFRKKAGAAASRIYDVAARANAPLFLPAGVIRFVLIAGFAVCALILYIRDQLGHMQYVEFYVILAGLVAGHIFGRLVRPLKDSLENIINHAKGIAVLAASACLFIVLMRTPAADNSYTGLCLACVVSFYFGSRS